LTIDHKILYDTESVSREYASRDYLEPAERTVLEILKPVLSGMDMLDMGVGGGRTTKYFAPLVKNYTGADYATAMIDVCLEKYGNDYFFFCCDARNMKEISDSSYDFILFSYNGIDSFKQRDRIASLREIHRVLRPDGYFCFSTHNLDWEGLADIFSLKKKTGIYGQDNSNKRMSRLRNRAKSVLKIFKLSLLNRSFYMSKHILKLRRKKRGHIYDDSLKGRAKVYYVSQDEQLRQLTETGFTNISTISRDGLITENTTLLNKGGWIYYLCQADK
jgi:ubiquinone/menaquinone biosynthesis C-methylase UbiE